MQINKKRLERLNKSDFTITEISWLLDLINCPYKKSFLKERGGSRSDFRNFLGYERNRPEGYIDGFIEFLVRIGVLIKRSVGRVGNIEYEKYVVDLKALEKLIKETELYKKIRDFQWRMLP